MFTLDTRMSDALAARPELRTILAAFHPAFAKLSHPILGKVLPRLVTVADAAKIAGVDPQAMLAVMELPGPPKELAHPTTHHDEPRPAWLDGAVVLLDVRPALAAGEEPFAAIMGALRELSAGHVLTVLAPFEPAPLRRVLGDRGWASHVCWEGECCRASFWRAADGRSVEAPVDAGDRLVRGGYVGGTFDPSAPGATLDVRGLEPPEPMRMALAALDTPAHLPLTLRHSREPALLYPRLRERGLDWEVSTLGEEVRVVIRAA